MERIELLNQETIKILKEKENYEHFGILEADTFKQTEMNEKNKKGVSQKNEKASLHQALQQKSY